MKEYYGSSESNDNDAVSIDSLQEQLNLVEDSQSISNLKMHLWNIFDRGVDGVDDLILQGFQTGRFEFDDESEMYRVNVILAKRGDPDAMLSNGLFCLNGIDGWPVDEDPRLWFEQSAKAGCLEARIWLATIDYLNGDEDIARPVFQDNVGWSDLAMLCLGAMYWNGDAGLERNRDMAMKIWSGFIDADPSEVELCLDDTDDVCIRDLLDNVMLYNQDPNN